MQTFSKKERLCSMRHKEVLFHNGQSHFVYPFKVTFFLFESKYFQDAYSTGRQKGDVGFLEVPGGIEVLNRNEIKQLLPYRVQLLITVPKRNFKRATDRNRLKRLVREGYRKNKTSFQLALHTHGKVCLLSLAYVGRQILNYSEIEHKIIVILQKIAEIVKSATVSDIQ